MTFSCSDFTQEIINKFAEHNLIDPDLDGGHDLEVLSRQCIHAIEQVVEKATSMESLFFTVDALCAAAKAKGYLHASKLKDQEVLPQDAPTVTPFSQRIKANRADIFMQELLDENLCLTSIADKHGVHTLADVTYLLRAITQDTVIEYIPTGESEIVDLVSLLPNAALWMTYITKNE